MKRGLFAEFEAPEPLLQALERVRTMGYRQFDAFTPYPMKEAEDLVGGGRRSPITWLALPFGLAGASLAYAVQWYCNAYDYPLNVGGKPPHSAPAFVPITFEMGVLAAALAAIAFLFAFAGLPELYHPIFELEGFDGSTRDRFWIGVDEEDPAFDGERLRAALVELGAKRIHLTSAAAP